MPPWKAEPGYGDFVGQHPLTGAEIDLIARWVATGAAEGDARELPPAPRFTEGWQLGQPDLVVSPSQSYTLQPSGTDVFRIFVIPLPVGTPRYVRGMEFHPNSQVVHHANIRLDRTPASRLLDEADPGPGYSGLIAHSAVYPDGYFLGWTPGQVPPLLPSGLAWQLDSGTDLVVELHMQPSGRPEIVRPTIGFFFGSDPPERTPAMLRLGRQNIDIPAGERHYVETDSFVLPVDVEVQAVQPHAHYRAREVKGIATLPDGSTKWLIYIKDWDFRWQHVFRYVKPITLPKGTTLSMEYTFDNAESNPRLPEHPSRVRWGQRSADEMGDLWIQVLTRTPEDLVALNGAFRPKALAEDIIGYEVLVRSEPDSAALHDTVALLYLDTGQPEKAAAHFAASVRLQPTSPAAHFNLATALSVTGRLDEAIEHYHEALRLKSGYAGAHANLGSVLLQRGQVTEALAELQEAVQLEPNNPQARYSLARAYEISGDVSSAIANFRRAIDANPDFASALADLSWLLATTADERLRDPQQAVRLAEHAADLTSRRDVTALDVLAAAYAAAGDFDRAIGTAYAALRLDPPAQAASGIRQRQELYRQHLPFRSP